MPSWQQLSIEPWKIDYEILPNVISVGSKRNIWGSNSYFTLYRWNDREDSWVGAYRAHSFSAAADGSVWCIFQNVIYYRLNAEWYRSSAQLGNPLQIAAGSLTNAWVIAQGTRHLMLYQYLSGKKPRWNSRATNKKWVSVAEDGTVWCINTNNNIDAYNREDDSWTPIPGPLTGNVGVTFSQVSVVNKKRAWALSTTNRLYLWNDSKWEEVFAPYQFNNISAASDGTVMGVNSYGQISTYKRCPDVIFSGLKLSVDPESIANYGTLEENVVNGYGMTGLMAVAAVRGIAPGTIFLFPGISVPEGVRPVGYHGAVSLNGKTAPPLVTYSNKPDYPTLHQQMAEKLLELDTRYFIGFSIKYYPWTTEDSVSYNSGTCNVYWFGLRKVSDCGCNNINWQVQIMTALANSLPT